MNGIKIFLFIAIFSMNTVLIESCKKNTPVTEANFTFTAYHTPIYVGDKIVFSNQSKNAIYYQWSFGDGTYSVSENPTHTYTQSGTYAVKLLSVGNNGMDSISKSLNIWGNITIWIGFTLSGIDSISGLGVQLGYTWPEVKNRFYGMDTLMYNDTFQLGYIHTLILPDKGVIITFYNFLPSTIDSLDVVREISFISPYTGMTSMGTSIGSNISTVFSTYFNDFGSYGDMQKPYVYIDSKQDTCYSYYTLGIQFWTVNPSPLVAQMDVYPSFTENSLIPGKKDRLPLFMGKKNLYKGQLYRRK